MVELTLPKQALLFTCLQYKAFENNVGKREISRNEQFLLFTQCFLPVWRTFCHFHQILNCCMQSLSVWKSLKFVVWERVKQTFLCTLKITYRSVRAILLYRHLQQYCSLPLICIERSWVVQCWTRDLDALGSSLFGSTHFFVGISLGKTHQYSKQGNTWMVELSLWYDWKNVE